MDSDNYYQILEISPQATKAEIKAAYYQLAKELHPDKLPPHTPERAKKLVEENYKKITEAYSCLNDPDKRKEYNRRHGYADRASEYTTSDRPSRQSNNSNNTRDRKSTRDRPENWLDADRIRLAAESLRLKIATIEREAQIRCDAKTHKLERELSSILSKINYKGDISRIQSMPDKAQSIKNGFLIGIVGFSILFFIRDYFIGFIGIILIFYGLFKIVYGIQMKKGYHEQVLKAKIIYQELAIARAKALKEKNEEILIYKHQIDKRILYFQRIPLASINKEFFTGLSAEDQVLLLVSIQGHQDPLNRELQDILKIVLGLSSFAALLGLSFFFRRESK